MDGITNSMDMSFSQLWETVMDREACPPAVKGGTRASDGNDDMVTHTPSPQVSLPGRPYLSSTTDLFKTAIFPAPFSSLPPSLLIWPCEQQDGHPVTSCNLVWRIPRDRGAWWATVCGVTKSRTRLSDQARHTTPLVIFPHALSPPMLSVQRCTHCIF